MRQRLVNVGFVMLTAALSATLPVALLAQQHMGGITGRVTDPTDAVIPSATVTALHQQTAQEREAITGSNGIYIFKLLQVGEYTLTVEAPGFKTFQRLGTAVVSGEMVTVDVRLELGEVSETVAVTAEAPVLDTTQSLVGTTRTVSEIGRLPIALMGNSSRSAAGFARTVAGVNWEPRESGGLDFMVISRSQIHGSMAGTWSYRIDGVESGMGEAESGSDFVSPIPEAIEEFRLSANTDASSGFNGGVTMQMTMKSGTNELHGSLFWYVRNDALNARTFFDTSGKPSIDKQNEAGFALGGPIWKNKTFFFTTLDIYRFRQAPSGRIATVPSTLMRQGDFSEWLGSQSGTDVQGRPVFRGQIYDSLTSRVDGQGGFIRDPFPGNVIPPERHSPIALGLQQFYASPTRPGISQNWVGLKKPFVIDKDQWTVKVDHHLNPRHRFTFAYEAVIGPFAGEGSGESGHSFIFGGSGFLAPEISDAFIDDRDSYRYRLNYLWTVSPQVLFNFRAAVTRNPSRVIGPFPFVGPASEVGRDVGLKGTLSPRAPRVAVQGVDAFGPFFGQFHIASQKTPFNADVSWSKGSHNLKIGAEYIALPFAARFEGTAHGAFFFSDRVAGLPGQPGTGVGYASFMLGEVDSGSVSTPSDSRAFSGAWAWYIQDQWRASPKFTLNYGLRYNLFIPLRRNQDRISTFDPTIPNPGAGGRLGALAFYGQGPGRNGLRTVGDYYKKAFAPNLGFAYSVNPKTVVRASYGLSYLPYWQKWYGTLGATAPTTGFSASRSAVTLDNGVTPAFNWNDGFPLTFPLLPITDPTLQNRQGIGFIDRSDNRPALAQNVAFEIGRELPQGVYARAAWVANLSRRLPTQLLVDLNSIDLSHLQLGNLLNAPIDSAEARDAGVARPYPGFRGSVAQALRPFPQYLGIPVLGAQVGSSNYHALQVNVQKRRGDMAFLIGYTVSKQLTNVSFTGFEGFGRGTVQHPQLLNTARSLLSLDRPQILNISWAYDLPFGRGKRFLSDASGVLDYLVGGWRLSAIQNYLSGRPLRVRSRQSIPGGFNGIWPVRVPGVPVEQTSCGDLDPGDPSRNRRLNSAAFANPAPFTLGNISQIPNVRGCSYLNETFQIDKYFQVTEQVRVHLGTMFVNLFNRHSWNDPNGEIANVPAFGTVRGTSAPRSVQLYAKIEF